MQDHLKEIIGILWSKRLPFVAYRLPLEKEVTILVQKSSSIESIDLDDIESVSGFIIAPFESVQTRKGYILEPDIILNSSHAPLSEVEKLPSVANHGTKNMLNNRIWSKEAYLEKANTVLNDLKKNKLQKLVLSRIVEKELKDNFVPGERLRFTERTKRTFL